MMGSSKIVFQISALSGYLVFIGALSELLHSTMIGFVILVISAFMIFWCLLHLIEFAITYHNHGHPNHWSADALEAVCFPILVTIHVVVNDNILIPIALAAVGTVIVSVAQLRGSPRTSSALALAVIRTSFQVALSAVMLGYWLNTVAAIFPVIPSMLAMLLDRQMPNSKIKDKQL